MSFVRPFVIVLSVAVIAGCKPAPDPAKWYLIEYENKQFIFQHDHKRYTAECFQSFSTGRKDPDSTPDCTGILTIHGVGQEIPEKWGDQVRWLSAGTFAIFTPAGDGGPQLQFTFVSIRESK